MTESQREALTSLAQYYVGSGMEGDGTEESDGGDEEYDGVGQGDSDEEESDGSDEEYDGVVQEDSEASENRDDRDCSQHPLLSKVAHGDTRARTRATPPGTRTANGTDNNIDGERPRKRQRNSLSQGRSGLKPDRNNGNREERSNAVGGSTAEDTSDGARSGTPDAHGNTVARSSQTRHPWQRVLRLTSLSLDPALQQHLTKYGPDPAKFLNDDGLFKYQVTDLSRESRSDAFIACYRYTEGLETRQAKDRVRWCFAMLMYYDLFQIIKPGRGRIGHLMVSDVLTHFGPILGPSTVTPEKALEQVNDWVLRGKKLNHICKQFGPGCLFFLGDVLTSNL